MEALVVLSTCPSPVASDIATVLVEEKCAACVNIVDGLQSVYHWRGQVETATEALLIIKTTADHYDELERRLRTLHPYDLPEIVAIPVVRGYAPYLEWLQGTHRP